jgi:hypothetical protein
MMLIFLRALQYRMVKFPDREPRSGKQPGVMTG